MNKSILKTLMASVLATTTVMTSSIALQAASTCPVTLTRPEAGSDSWCNDGWINYFVDAYNLDMSDWTSEVDGGNNRCDTTLHFGRLMNGVWVLNYADGPAGKARDDFSGNILHWGGNYSMMHIDSITPVCEDGPDTDIAYTDISGDVEVYLPFFFSRTAVQRASTLLHESRHGYGCWHNGNDGDNKCPARSASCDESYGDGCPLHAGGAKGGTGYQVLWLWWFTAAADSITGTPDRKAQARDLANTYLNSMFDHDPCFNITATGQSVNMCPR